jgi:DNA-binding beta-propeller fold protein YncE
MLRVLFISILLCSQAFAMGSVPIESTAEAGIPDIEYVGVIGGMGSGDIQFMYPRDVKFAPMSAVSANGAILVADTGNFRVQVIDPDGKQLLFKFGMYGSGQGQFLAPVAVASDISSKIYVVDRDGNHMQKFDSQGNYISQVGSLGTASGSFSQPSGILSDRWGRIIIVDKDNNRMQRFDENGNFFDTFGSFGMGAGFFNKPTSVVMDEDHRLYVTDTGNNRVQKLDESGWPISVIGKDGLHGPQGIAVDDTYVYVTDTENNRIVVFDKKGKALVAFGKAGTNEQEFSGPTGISVGTYGRIYIADTNNHRIQVYRRKFISSVY